jgi:hypothetical protein
MVVGDLFILFFKEQPGNELSGFVNTHASTTSERPLCSLYMVCPHFSKEDSIKPWCDQLECQLFEAEYFADEDSVFMPAYVAAIVHPSQRETLRVPELG